MTPPKITLSDDRGCIWIDSTCLTVNSALDICDLLLAGLEDRAAVVKAIADLLREPDPKAAESRKHADEIEAKLAEVSQ